MPHIRHQAALAAVVCVLASCQQTDQQLPFELDGGGQTVSIGPSGGIISVPPNFSIEIPPGALASSVSIVAAKRITAFPNDAGQLVPIDAYDITAPAGTTLALPARVQISVPPELLDAGEELSLSVGLLTSGGDVVTQVTSYDLNNGFLVADIGELGPVAAVVASDVIPVLDLDDMPALTGGSFAPPAPVSPVGPALDHGPVPPGAVRFTASCSTFVQSCFASGIVSIWVDETVYERLGADIILYNATVSGEFEFSGFVGNVPTLAYGEMTLDGELRARLNSVIAGRRAGDEISMHTGAGATPSNTAVTFSGNIMTLAQTSEDSPSLLEYGVTGVGTGEQLTIRFEGDIVFSNPSPQAPDVGHIVVQVRLRR
jgi:hypothetical protein